MMTNLPELSEQFRLLPKSAQDAILKEIAANGSSDNGQTPFSISMRPAPGLPMAVQGAVFKNDASKYQGTVGPLTRADLAMIDSPDRTHANASGALSQAAPVVRASAPPDIAEMLARFVPQDDSSSKYLAMAAAFGRPTGFGTFGETIANVADALNQQKLNQQKLRAQYTPLIMQQIAAQQAREEQAVYRMEAQRQAQQAQALAQQAAAERAASERSSREQIAADRLTAAGLADKAGSKPPTGYVWGPTTENGQPSLIPIKGGPADAKLSGVLNADTQALNGAMSSFDRLASAANQVLTHPGLPGITGLRGKIPNIPGSDAANANALLDTLKSQVGFGVLQDMRNQSKTGGALGAVSEKELVMLQANLAALDKAQSVEQFSKGLRQIMEYAEQAKDRMRQAYNLKHGGLSAPNPQGAALPALPTQDAIAAEIARRKKGS